MPPSTWHAVAAGAVAAALVACLTPFAVRLAHRIGAVDEPRARGLSDRPMPRLGGVAIFGGVIVSAFLFLPLDGRFGAILLGAAIITVVGALDDVHELGPFVKLLGQSTAALVPVLEGVRVYDFTLPFVHRVELGDLGVPLTLAGIVLIMNVVNFSDGVDGLAAGVCAIAAAAFVVIAFDLQRANAAVLAAIIAGAALGFLIHNFHPATVFMGDCGSNLLGLLLACVAIEGTVKTQAVLALLLPLIVLAVPFLDTTFVVLKRLKYRKPFYGADREHFHHRMDRIGFSTRRTVLYLYVWTLLLAGLAIAPTLIAGLTLTERTVHPSRLTEGMAIMHTGLVAGVAPGAALSGYVVDHSGASAAYLVCIAAGVAAALAAQVLPRTEPTRQIEPAPAQSVS
jgi:UDP-GlcNAc:undecaprenyl-phosphate GlcNAc-1-phosphate transferase